MRADRINPRPVMLEGTLSVASSHYWQALKSPLFLGGSCYQLESAHFFSLSAWSLINRLALARVLAIFLSVASDWAFNSAIC